MKEFNDWVVQFARQEDGPTAIEYAVMMALVIVVCIVAITSVGSSTNKQFSNASLKTATQPSSS